MRELLPALPPPNQATAAASACVCAAGLHGDQINDPPPYAWWDIAGTFLPPPDGSPPPWRIAVALDGGRWNYALLELSDGATANPPVPKNQVLIGLANRTSWAKEIWAQNFCTGRTASVFQSGTNATPNRILLDRADCRSGADTIVFSKPGFLGAWHDVGHFNPAHFWPAFGGTVADFTWVFD